MARTTSRLLGNRTRARILNWTGPFEEDKGNGNGQGKEEDNEEAKG